MSCKIVFNGSFYKTKVPLKRKSLSQSTFGRLFQRRFLPPPRRYDDGPHAVGGRGIRLLLMHLRLHVHAAP